MEVAAVPPPSIWAYAKQEGRRAMAITLASCIGSNIIYSLYKGMWGKEVQYNLYESEHSPYYGQSFRPAWAAAVIREVPSSSLFTGLGYLQTIATLSTLILLGKALCMPCYRPSCTRATAHKVVVAISLTCTVLSFLATAQYDYFWHITYQHCTKYGCPTQSDIWNGSAIMALAATAIAIVSYRRGPLRNFI